MSALVWVHLIKLYAESIAWFIEDQAFRRRMIWLLRHPPCPSISRQQVISLSQSSFLSLAQRRRLGRSQITWLGESLVLYKSFIFSAFSPGAASSIKPRKLLAKSLYAPTLEYCLVLTGLILEVNPPVFLTFSTRVVKQRDHQREKTTLLLIKYTPTHPRKPLWTRAIICNAVDTVAYMFWINKWHVQVRQ